MVGMPGDDDMAEHLFAGQRGAISGPADGLPTTASGERPQEPHMYMDSNHGLNTTLVLPETQTGFLPDAHGVCRGPKD